MKAWDLNWGPYSQFAQDFAHDDGVINLRWGGGWPAQREPNVSEGVTTITYMSPLVYMQISRIEHKAVDYRCTNPTHPQIWVKYQ